MKSNRRFYLYWEIYALLTGLIIFLFCIPHLTGMGGGSIWRLYVMIFLLWAAVILILAWVSKVITASIEKYERE